MEDHAGPGKKIRKDAMMYMMYNQKLSGHTTPPPPQNLTGWEVFFRLEKS